MGVNIIRLALHRFFETRDALVEFTLVLENETKIVAGLEIARIEFDRFAMMCFRFFVTAEGA